MTINPGMTSLWMQQQATEDAMRRRAMGVPDNGHTNHERPMKDITPKPDPVVDREARMISGPIKRMGKAADQ